jgi:uncharacterized protein (TIGR02145 family)
MEFFHRHAQWISGSLFKRLMNMGNRIHKYSMILAIALIFRFITPPGLSQVPDRMNFQQTIRNTGKELVINKYVAIRIQIRQGSQFGPAVYVETQIVLTNSDGLVTLEIGGGTPVLGSFTDIDWTKGPYFLQTETDLTGAGYYNVAGVMQMISVPYALYASSADSIPGGISESDPAFNASLSSSISSSDIDRWNSKLDNESQDLGRVLVQGNDAHGSQIKNLEIPIHANDMATKAYVDSLEMKVNALEEVLVKAGVYDVKDVDGNLYHAVKIGKQIWMKENLRTTRYNDGLKIPYIVSDQYHYAETPAYYWLKNDSAKYGSIYGALYNFYVVETGKLCPAGWHVPDYSEWNTLAAELGGFLAAGGRMKEAGTEHWISPNTGATNESGFTALPGAYLAGYSSRGGGGFQREGYSADWWSDTPTVNYISGFGNSYYDSRLYSLQYAKFLALSVRCIHGDESERKSLASITTTIVTDILQKTATGGGNITSDGGSSILARGVCWSEKENPDTGDFKTYDGFGPGQFVSHLKDLNAIRTYYIRAYAINKTGIAYGNELSFTTRFVYDSIIDVDGNIYKTIKIGTQTWMAENLKTARYNNGDSINKPLSWSGDKTGAYSIYGDDPAYEAVYGKLYNFYTITDPRGLCPGGWKVPAYDDWMALTNYLGGYQVAGKKLKETGLTHWIRNYTATNESGFTALPGGWWNGAFYELGDHGYFWTSSDTSEGPWFWMIYGDYQDLSMNRGAPKDGFSVRCMKK